MPPACRRVGRCNLSTFGPERALRRQAERAHKPAEAKKPTFGRRCGRSVRFGVPSTAEWTRPFDRLAQHCKHHHPPYSRQDTAKPYGACGVPCKLNRVCAGRNCHTCESEIGRRLGGHLNAIYGNAPGRDVKLMEEQSE